MYLFEVASRHMTWLADRQSVSASNIANADTPGYRARDVAPFQSLLGDGPSSLTLTSPMHMGVDAADIQAADREDGTSWGSSHSGNNVSMEQELMTASSTSRMMSLDTNVLRSFQRMLLSSVKV